MFQINASNTVLSLTERQILRSYFLKVKMPYSSVTPVWTLQAHHTGYLHKCLPPVITQWAKQNIDTLHDFFHITIYYYLPITPNPLSLFHPFLWPLKWESKNSQPNYPEETWKVVVQKKKKSRQNSPLSSQAYIAPYQHLFYANT